MSDVVYYHHPADPQLSIKYVGSTLEDASERAERCGPETLTAIEEYELNESVYVLYTGTKTPDHAEELEYDIRDAVEEMSWANRVITTRLLGLFEAVVEEKYEQEAERLSAYKAIELDRIPEALERVKWSGSVAEVAGRLVSCLILRHSLPNANHRTSIGMLSLYYQAISPQFEMPSVATEDYDWEGWVDTFIQDSKRLITVRRNTIRFRILEERGCHVVERKDGLRMHLPDYDLTMDAREAQKAYARDHTEHCIAFAERVLDEADNAELLHGRALHKQTFAERLQEME